MPGALHGIRDDTHANRQVKTGVGRTGTTVHAAVSPSASWGADIALPEKTQGVLKTHCQRCHGQDGKAKGGFNYGDRIPSRRANLGSSIG